MEPLPTFVTVPSVQQGAQMLCGGDLHEFMLIGTGYCYTSWSSVPHLSDRKHGDVQALYVNGPLTENVHNNVFVSPSLCTLPCRCDHGQCPAERPNGQTLNPKP